MELPHILIGLCSCFVYYDSFYVGMLCFRYGNGILLVIMVIMNMGWLIVYYYSFSNEQQRNCNVRFVGGFSGYVFSYEMTFDNVKVWRIACCSDYLVALYVRAVILNYITTVKL